MVLFVSSASWLSARKSFLRGPRGKPKSLRSSSVRSRTVSKSTSLSMNSWEYLLKPSFSSHCAITSDMFLDSGAARAIARVDGKRSAAQYQAYVSLETFRARSISA